ncbi:hypothetical protein [Arthrobacter sp. MMS18-M83]|uniref:hypothetical protein n=1 Tax=Arthrobacter sp. MMS18-M83 TaxID=2996261 RepID=UPI00227D4D57|nr:hypothetical protein [Arthrobacter sp. MMS18-M83]WAH99720.1 hypothetical protein OW521_21105 [Arthrobacter sp. MMS18-M83]
MAAATLVAKTLDKPSVITQYGIVWDKLCGHSGAMPVGAFSIEHGMEFLEDALHIRSHPLSEATSYRWMKAIYLLSDFKRTGVLTLRRPRREFVFMGAAAPFQAYMDSMTANGMSSAHLRNSSIYLERLAAFLDHAGLADISGLEPVHVHGFVENLAVYEPRRFTTRCASCAVCKPQVGARRHRDHPPEDRPGRGPSPAQRRWRSSHRLPAQRQAALGLRVRVPEGARPVRADAADIHTLVHTIKGGGGRDPAGKKHGPHA